MTPLERARVALKHADTALPQDSRDKEAGFPPPYPTTVDKLYLRAALTEADRLTSENHALKRTISECMRASPVTTVAFDGNVPAYISSCFEAMTNNLATARAERANLAAQRDRQRARADRMESDAHELRGQLDRAKDEAQLGKPSSKKREGIPPMRVLVTRDESGNLQTTHLPPVKS